MSDSLIYLGSGKFVDLDACLMTPESWGEGASADAALRSLEAGTGTPYGLMTPMQRVIDSFFRLQKEPELPAGTTSQIHDPLSEKPQVNLDISGVLVIFVLGHTLMDDGSTSRTLQNRLMEAKFAFEQQPQSLLLVSGGVVGKMTTDLGQVMPTQARVMKDWLVANGVPPSKIIEEDRSTDTVENILFSAALLSEPLARQAPPCASPQTMPQATSQIRGLKRLSLVTSSAHAGRAFALLRLHLEQQGLDWVAAVNLPQSGDFPMNFSERFLLFKDIGRILGFWAYAEPKNENGKTGLAGW